MKHHNELVEVKDSHQVYHYDSVPQQYYHINTLQHL